MIYRELTWKQFYGVFERTAMTPAVIMFLIISARWLDLTLPECLGFTTWVMKNHIKGFIK